MFPFFIRFATYQPKTYHVVLRRLNAPLSREKLIFKIVKLPGIESATYWLVLTYTETRTLRAREVKNEVLMNSPAESL